MLKGSAGRSSNGLRAHLRCFNTTTAADDDDDGACYYHYH